MTTDEIKIRACSIICTDHPEWGTFGVMEDRGLWYSIFGSRGGWRTLSKSELGFWSLAPKRFN